MPEREANPYKIHNQWQRAVRLYETLRLDMIDSYGTDADAHAVAAAIHDMTVEDWVTVANRADIDPPSEETLERVTIHANIAVEVADRADQHPLEAFDGSRS